MKGAADEMDLWRHRRNSEKGKLRLIHSAAAVAADDVFALPLLHDETSIL